MAVQKFLQNGANDGTDGTFVQVLAGSLSGSVFAGQLFDVQFVIPGGGSVLTTGNKGWLHIPVAATISAWRILADQTGTVTVDILRTNNGFPSTSMVGAGTKPNLAGSQFAQVVPSGWTSTALVVDDWVAFNVTAATTVTQVTICLTCTR